MRVAIVMRSAPADHMQTALLESLDPSKSIPGTTAVATSALVGRLHGGSHCLENVDTLDANGERLTLENCAVPVRGHGVGDSYFIQVGVSQHQYDVVAVVAPRRVGAQLG